MYQVQKKTNYKTASKLVLCRKQGVGVMNNKQSFYAKVSRFLESYLTIPKDTYYYEQNGNLTRIAIKTCVNYLISGGVFSNANDMKSQAFKDFNIILPDWVFEDVKKE